jgi:hypothetical protein
MKAMGREAEGIKLPDGTYYGSIMVFHHLHCLVRYATWNSFTTGPHADDK